MFENKLKQKMEKGELAIGSTIMEFREVATVKLLALCGFDFIVIDMEHTIDSMETAGGLIAMARALGITPIVRIPDASYHVITKPLDHGAQGIIIPRVETADQVREIVDIIRYQPQGKRGLGLGLANSNYGCFDCQPEEFVQTMRKETIVILQVENEKVISELDEILSIPEVVGAVVGCDDLSMNLGIPGQTEHSRFKEMVRRVIQKCREHGVPSGIAQGNIESVKRWVSEGMRFIWYSSDFFLLLQAGSQAVSELRNFYKSKEEGS